VKSFEVVNPARCSQSRFTNANNGVESESFEDKINEAMHSFKYSLETYGVLSLLLKIVCDRPGSRTLSL
jgi:hypothetical protein